MRYTQNKKLFHVPLAIFLAVSSLTTLAFVQHANAATMDQVFVRFDHMVTGAQTTGTVCAQPSADDLSSTEANVIVTFPDDYVLGAFGTFTVNTTNLAWPAGAIAWPGITAPAGAGDIVGQAVTFASSDLSSSSALYCFNWTDEDAVQQPAIAAPDQIGSIETTTSGDAQIDIGQFATATIEDEEIVVTATVPVAFSFELDGISDDLGNLDIDSIASSPTPRSAIVNTNAKNGWMVWAKDSNEGLTSASAGYTIASNCTGTTGVNEVLTTNNEGYNLGVTQSQIGGEGMIDINDIFDNTAGTLGNGAGLCAEYQTLAASDGSASDASITLTNYVTIAGATPAATDYTDTITVIGAGLF